MSDNPHFWALAIYAVGLLVTLVIAARVFAENEYEPEVAGFKGSDEVVRLWRCKWHADTSALYIECDPGAGAHERIEGRWLALPAYLALVAEKARLVEVERAARALLKDMETGGPGGSPKVVGAFTTTVIALRTALTPVPRENAGPTDAPR